MTKLCDLGTVPGEPDTQETMCSVGWSQRGTFLALGVSSGETQIWDISKGQWCVCSALVQHVKAACICKPKVDGKDFLSARAAERLQLNAPLHSNC